MGMGTLDVQPDTTTVLPVTCSMGFPQGKSITDLPFSLFWSRKFAGRKILVYLLARRQCKVVGECKRFATSALFLWLLQEDLQNVPLPSVWPHNW